MDHEGIRKLRRLLRAAVPVIGNAMALVEKIDRITKSDRYVRLMLEARERGIAFESADMELADLKSSIDSFMGIMEKSR